MVKNDNQNGSKIRKPQISRRDFIKIAGCATTGAMLTSCFPEQEKKIPPASEHRNAIIIGSGFGGSVAAFRLAKAGIPVTLFEKGKRWDAKPNAKVFSPYLYPDGRSTWLNNRTVVPIGLNMSMPV